MTSTYTAGEISALEPEPEAKPKKDKYELKRRIGIGSMGEVFQGYIYGTAGFRRRAAFKRIRPELAEDPALRQRLVREASTCASLDHPNIVSVINLYRSAHGELHMVMEYVQGASLHELMRYTRLPATAAAFVVREILAGLWHIHDHNVVHRDVTPYNVLVGDELGTVKLTDFGLAFARLAGEDHDPDDIRGKLPYCAPEQILGEELDGRADLFSVGVLFYELLTGTLPVAGATNVDEACRQVLEAPIVPPSERNPQVPTALDPVVMRLLARDRNERYPNALAAIEALNTIEALSAIGCFEKDWHAALAEAQTRPLPPRAYQAPTASGWFPRVIAPEPEPAAAPMPAPGPGLLLAAVKARASRARAQSRWLWLLFAGACCLMVSLAAVYMVTGTRRGTAHSSNTAADAAQAISRKAAPLPDAARAPESAGAPDALSTQAIRAMEAMSRRVAEHPRKHAEQTARGHTRRERTPDEHARPEAAAAAMPAGLFPEPAAAAEGGRLIGGKIVWRRQEPAP